MYDADSLTHEQLAGQRLMVGFEGKILDDDLRLMILDLRVGGLVLFKRNVSDPPQVAELCEAAQAYAAESGNPPLMIAIDQEGGPVARLGPPFTVFPGNRAIGAARSEEAAREFGTVTARELKGVGITMNLAPVLDIAPPGFDSVMADRVFGEDGFPEKLLHGREGGFDGFDAIVGNPPYVATKNESMARYKPLSRRQGMPMATPAAAAASPPAGSVTQKGRFNLLPRRVAV